MLQLLVWELILAIKYIIQRVDKIIFYIFLGFFIFHNFILSNIILFY